MLRYSALATLSLLLCIVSSAYSQAPVSEPLGVEERLIRIETLLQNQGLLQMLQQLDRLEQEVSQLRGEIEVQNHTLEQLQQRQRALYTDIDQRLQGLEQNGTANNDGLALVPGQAIDEPFDPANPPLQTLTPTTSPIEQAPGSPQFAPTAGLQVSTPQPANYDNAGLTPRPLSTRPVFDPTLGSQIVTNADPLQTRLEYDQAFTMLKQSQYEMAIRAFREYLAKYPISDYSDNAQYWLGEAYYVMRQFELALEEYNHLIRNYPDSQKYTHALLKIAYSQHELGLLDEARQTLQDLQMNHPRTTASRLADERMKLVEASIRERQETNPEFILQP
jgi:tol-pal system protein YbgF